MQQGQRHGELTEHLRRLGIPLQHPYGGGMIDTVELIMACPEPEVWRTLVWTAQKSLAAMEQTGGQGIPTADPGKCDVLSGASADVASIVGALRSLRKR